MPNRPQLIEPYGGSLVDLLVADPRRRVELYRRAEDATPLPLSLRALCDLEMLATGGLSPLATFMAEADYRSVLNTMRLTSGVLYPIPITLPLPDAVNGRRGELLALQDRDGELLALLTIDEVFEWDLTAEALAVCGTTDARHPLMAEMAAWPRRYASGPLEVLNLPRHAGFAELRRTPREVRAALAQLGRRAVVAFQTRNPMHRVHEELTKRAARAVGGSLLIHPVVGQTKPGDVDVTTRVRCYRELVSHYYDPSRTLLSLLPLAMRMAGPREALWHATIRRNYGATHMIVGRDHAGSGLDSCGRPFHAPYAAQALVRRHEAETGVTAVVFEELVYVSDERRYVERSLVHGQPFVEICGTHVRDRYLATGTPLPNWFTRPEVAKLLAARARRPQDGFCVWLMGLSGAGKSTIAAALAARFREHHVRPKLLDGDALRSTISKDLGFSRKDRDANVLRIGSVAADLVRQGHVVIGAVITPYAATRARVREMVGENRFVLVYVDTPLALCAQRDVKGLYGRARRGELSGLTGVDDPFEAPTRPDVRIDTSSCGPEQAAARIMAHLAAVGLTAERAPATETAPESAVLQ